VRVSVEMAVILLVILVVLTNEMVTEYTSVMVFVRMDWEVVSGSLEDEEVAGLFEVKATGSLLEEVWVWLDCWVVTPKAVWEVSGGVDET